MMKKLTLFLIISYMLMILLPSASAHWADESINYCVSNGFIESDSILVSEPDAAILRGTAVQLVSAAMPDGVKVKDIVKGDETGDLWLERKITREEFFTVIGRAFEIKESGDVFGYAFTDIANISDYAAPFINELAKTGLIKGYPDGTIQPKANVTHAEAAAIVARVHQNMAAIIPPSETEEPAPAPTAALTPGSGGKKSTVHTGALREPRILLKNKSDCYIEKPAMVTFRFNNGTNNPITRIGWFKVGLLSGTIDTAALCDENRDNVTMIEGLPHEFEMSIETNGTYIFVMYKNNILLRSSAFVFSRIVEEAIVIDHTLSETENTYYPVKVRIDVQSSTEIKQITWVKMERETCGAPSENGFLPASVDISEYESNGEIYQNYAAYNYCLNAFSRSEAAQPLESGEFETTQNGVFYICAEDIDGNKAFKRIVVDSIKTVKLTPAITVSDGHMTVKAEMAGENPNAPVEEMYFFLFKPGTLSNPDFLTYRLDGNADIAAIIARNEAVDCMAGLTGEGVVLPLPETADINTRYLLMSLDAWGNYTMQWIEGVEYLLRS